MGEVANQIFDGLFIMIALHDLLNGLKLDLIFVYAHLALQSCDYLHEVLAFRGLMLHQGGFEVICHSVEYFGGYRFLVL